MTLTQRNHRASPVTPERPKVSMPFANMNRILSSHSEDSQDKSVDDDLHVNPNQREALLEPPIFPRQSSSNSSNSKNNDNNANTQPIMTQRDRPSLIIASMWSFFIVWIFCLNGFNFLGADNNPHNDNNNHHGHTKKLDPKDWHNIQAGHVLKIVDTSTDKVQKAFLIQVDSAKMEKQNDEDENSVAILEHEGPHVVSVLDITAAPGDNPDMLQEPPMIRLVGEAIVPIPLVPTTKTKGQKQQWTGTFTLPPIDGMYFLESDYDTTTPIFPATYTVQHSRETTPFQVRSSDKWVSALVPLLNRHGAPTWSSSMSLFPSIDNFWIQTPHIHGFSLASDNDDKDSLSKQQYVWANAQTQLVTSRSNNAANANSDRRWTSANTRGKTSETSSQVSLSSTLSAPHQSWFQAFNQLSNYEIVCWIGGRSAELASQVFLSLRQDLFPAQRPFKFHYHPILKTLEQPDITWNDEWQGKFRKCKHVFVILDDDIFMENEQPQQQEGDSSKAAKLNGMSAEDYRSKLVTFLHHLTKAFPDPTFPLWVFTIALETPLRARQLHHCYDKKKHDDEHSHSLDHPCNLVIYDIFAQKEELFDTKDQSRIRLLNNTDLSMAMMPGTTATSITSITPITTTTTSTSTNHNHHPRLVDLMGMIALRTYVIVGKQVEEWRGKGQIGKIDGLHRNGTIEPNFDLVPYKWN